jgi:hypothetical protein
LSSSEKIISKTHGSIQVMSRSHKIANTGVAPCVMPPPPPTCPPPTLAIEQILDSVQLLVACQTVLDVGQRLYLAVLVSREVHVVLNERKLLHPRLYTLECRDKVLGGSFITKKLRVCMNVNRFDLCQLQDACDIGKTEVMSFTLMTMASMVEFPTKASTRRRIPSSPSRQKERRRCFKV